jgi:hypothetical protein
MSSLPSSIELGLGCNIGASMPFITLPGGRAEQTACSDPVTPASLLDVGTSLPNNPP